MKSVSCGGRTDFPRSALLKECQPYLHINLLIVKRIKKSRAYFLVSAYALLLHHLLDTAFSLQALC